MAFSNALGYPSAIWACMQGALLAASGVDPTDPQTAASVFRAALQTLRYGRDSLAAWQTATALSSLYVQLDSITALPLTLSTATAALVPARIAAIATTSRALTALLPIPRLSQSLVAAGQPGMTDPGLIEWAMTATPEPHPSGLTAATLPQMAAAEASAWAEVSLALAQQGVTVAGSTRDACTFMGQAAQLTANDLAALAVSPALPIAGLWNALAVLPCLTRVAASVANDPTSDASQQIAVMRYVILLGMQGLAVALTNLRESAPDSILLTKVRKNDTLMDIAARELGDYTRWTDIAAVNGLVPPYIVPTRPTNGLSVAAWGDQIYLPTTANPATVTAKFDYDANYLGTDIDYGPLNGSMPLWTGDFATVTGYLNFGRALGRRVITPLGALIYHSDYGSRIPGEVGAIQDESQGGVLAAYAESALRSDPRVNDVPSVNVTLGANYGARVVAQVIPNGAPGGASTAVNEVLQPQQ